MQVNEEAHKRLEERHRTAVAHLQEALASKDFLVKNMTDELQEKDKIVSALELSTRELETQLRAVQEELESKEATLAVFRRKSAKDTEVKLRERDKQIAALERELADAAGRMTVVDAQDTTSCEYTKNVMLKFLCATGEEVRHFTSALKLFFTLD